MLGPARYLADFARFAATRGAQEHDDAQAVSFTPSLHSKLILGLAVPFAGELTCEHLDALTPGAYRCGQTYGIHVEVAGASFYHQGSANLIDDAIRVRGVDYFLAGVAGRGFTERYWERILTRLEPRTIVPTTTTTSSVPCPSRRGSRPTFTCRTSRTRSGP